MLGIEPSQELKDLEQAILRQAPELQLGRDTPDRPAQRTELRNQLRNPYKGLRPFTAADAGGVSGAIAARAERLYGNLDSDEQEATRRLFSRLVTFGEGTEDTRRRVPRSEVEPLGLEDQIAGVINAYTTHRFLSTDRDPTTQDATVEIAHEALLREWPRLRGWIDDDRDGLRLLRHVSDAATSWNRLGRDQGELYRGARLEQALAWQAEHPEDLNPLEAEFLDASRELQDAEERADEERARHRVKQNRRLKIALAIVALALAGAIAGAVVALDQRGTAREQTDRAEAEAVRASEAATEADTERARAQEETARAEAARTEEANARAEAETARTEEANARAEAETASFNAETGRLVAEAASHVDDDRRQALLLAAETHRRAPSLETLGALQRVLVANGNFQGYLRNGGDYLELEFSADGERLIALGNGTIEIYDLTTRTLIEVFDIEQAIESSPQTPERAASLSRGGEEAVVATATGDVVVYSVEDGSAVATIRPDGAPVTEVVLAPSDGRVAVGHEDGSVSLWNRDGTGRPVRFNANGQENRVTELAFSPDGTLLATASADWIFTEGEAPIQPEPARMWNTTSGAQVGTDLPLTPEDAAPDSTPIANLGFSADGETLITSGPQTLRRWSVPSGRLLSSATSTIPGAELPFSIGGFATLPSGRVALNANGFLVVADGASLEPAGEFADPQVILDAGIAASADGSLVAFGGTTGIFVWSPSGQQLLAQAIPTGLPGGVEPPASAIRRRRLHP